MTGALLTAVRTVRFRAWALVAGLRLRRLGGRLVLELDGGVPRCLGLPALDLGASAGTLRLRIGRDVRLGRHCVLDVSSGRDGTIAIGDRVVFQDAVRLQPWGGEIRLADDVQIRDRCELKSAGVLALGPRAICGRTTTLHCEESVTLGACVGLAERVTIIDSDHGFDGSDTFFMEQPLRTAPVVLEDNVFVATNGVVLRGSTIGRSSVVAAGAVVNGGDFPAAHVIGGVPARTLAPLSG